MNRYKFAAVLIGSLALAAGTSARQIGPFGKEGLKAKAEIKGDGIVGTATLREVETKTGGTADPKFDTGVKGVEISVDVTGLKPGTHGIHIHAVGKCEGPAFTSAGGHFDPGPAGNMNPDMNHPFHMGDLPNIVADAKGHASYKAVTTRATIADGPLSLFGPDGTAIIIHANPDQGVTAEDKAGKSGGPRVACGVITK
jgi:Cu-Zn family superoxide dismutase